MKQFYAIFKKEIQSYFNSPLAYIFTTIFLVVGNWLFFQSFFLYSQATMRGYFSLLPWIFLFITPALTMRLWAEEKKSGTMEILLTFSVKDTTVVLAKFFSSLAFLGIVLMLSVSIPISVAFFGNLDIGLVIGGYLSSLFLGALYLSIGLFLSALTKNQIVAFLLAVVSCFLLFLISSSFVLQAVPFFAPVLKVIGSASHFENMSKGLLDTRDILYFVSVTGLFLYLNNQVLSSRSWKA